MKKFYTCIGQQKIQKQFYGDENGTLYNHCKDQVYNSIIVTLLESIKEERFKIVALDSMNSERSKYNIQLLVNELDYYFKDQYELSIVECSGLETSNGQLQIFKDIYSTIEENDEIYFDITFGYRTTPMLAMAACNYGNKFIKGVKIKKIFYTLFKFGESPDYIHKIIDVTTIYKINQFMENSPASSNGSMFQLLDMLFMDNN